MKKKYNKNNGYTLVELVLFMGLFSVLLVMIANIFTVLVDKQLEIQSLTYVEADSSYLIDRLRYDIHRADSVSFPASIGDSENSLSLDIGGETFTYGTSGNLFQLTNTQGVFALNSLRTRVTNVSFERSGNIGGEEAITIDFTVESLVQQASGVETKQVHTTISL